MQADIAGTTGGSRSRWSVSFVALTAVLALVAASCSSGSSSHGATSATKHRASTASSSSAPKAVTVRLSPSQAADASIGAISVHVPAHGVDGKGELSGAPATGEIPALPNGLAFASPPVTLEVQGTNLVKNVTLNARAEGSPSDKATATSMPGAMLAFYDQASGTWTPVASTGKNGTSFRFSSDHLSLWATLTLDAAKVDAAIGSFFNGFLGVANAPDPTCDGADVAAALGIKVNSDSGDLVKWCYGVNDQGAPTLTVENNRNYALEFDYPDSWTPHAVGDPDTVMDRIVAGVVTLVSPTTAGTKALIVAGGKTVWFDVPDSSSGQMSVSPSVPAYLASALLYGVETFATTFGKIPGVKSPDATTSAKIVDLVFASKSCLDEMNKLVVTNVSDASSAGSVFRAAVNLATGCVGDVWESAYGITGLAAAFAASVVLWLVDGVKLVVQGVQAAVDSAVYWRTYRIAIDATQKADPTLGAVWAPYQKGFGEVRPANVFNGGDPTGAFGNITWDSWGGSQAHGHGTGLWVGPGEIVAAGHSEPIELVAYDLQVCNGQLMYRHLATFFPQHGESFNPATNGEAFYDLCTGHATINGKTY